MQLELALARHKRVPLTRSPTPLQVLPQLSRRLGVDISLKRDDLTDLALGGDKARKLEYELAEPVAEGADWLVGCGSSQSNLARLLAAASRQLGLGCSLVLSQGKHPETQGNLLVLRLMGVDVRMVVAEDVWDLEDECMQLCEELRAAGHKPHYVPVSGTTPKSCLGYMRAGYELATQIISSGVEPAALYVPFGTGGIATGLALALRDRGLRFTIVASSVNRPVGACRQMLDSWCSSVSELLGAPWGGGELGVEVRDDQLGDGYGSVTTACLEAMAEFAETEGILLDPVYSGKTAAALLADCRDGRWPVGAHLLMLHSGGVPAIFAYQAEIVEHLARRQSHNGTALGEPPPSATERHAGPTHAGDT